MPGQLLRDLGDDRAVSDVLAFVLIFSIIITSVGFAYVFGMGALESAQVSQQNNNAERGFLALTVTFNDLQTGRGEDRLSQLNPRGGRISVQDDPRVTISVDGEDRVDDQSVGALNYDHEGTTVSYELGATFRSDDGNSVMLRSPEFVCSPSAASGQERVVVSYANLTASSPSSITSSSTMRIRATEEDTDVHYPINRTGAEDTREISSDVTIRIDDSPHADAWERYFDERDWTGVSRTGSTVSATCDAEVAYVRETEMAIELRTG